MATTRQIVAAKIEANLRHQIPLAELVNWAENEIAEGEFDSIASRDAVARLGLSDVREFGLNWDDFEQLLRTLGFNAKVSIENA
jgi:hypothetical protein